MHTLFSGVYRRNTRNLGCSRRVLVNVVHENDLPTGFGKKEYKDCTSILINRPGCNTTVHTGFYDHLAKGKRQRLHSAGSHHQRHGEGEILHVLHDQNGVITSGNALYPNMPQRKVVPNHFFRRRQSDFEPCELWHLIRV